jgi:hypothetical protein
MTTRRASSVIIAREFASDGHHMRTRARRRKRFADRLPARTAITGSWRRRDRSDPPGVVTLTLVSLWRLFRGFGWRTWSRRRVWGGHCVFQVLHDVILQVGDAFEGASSNALSGDFGEEAFDYVEPGRRGRCEMQVEARMRLEPAFDGQGLKRGIVVDDEMQSQTGGGGSDRSA